MATGDADELGAARAEKELRQIVDKLSAVLRAGNTEVVEEAIAQADSPYDIELCLNAAGVLESPAEAKWFIDRAVALAPRDGNVVTRAAHLLHVHGFSFEARRLTEQAEWMRPFELSPELDYLVGILARDAGDAREGEDAFAAAFSSRPEESAYGLAYAISLAKQQRIAEALSVADTALGHSPGDESLLDLRRILAAELGLEEPS